MEAKKYIILFYFILKVSSFSYVSPINIQQKMEILERKSQLQALEIQLLQQELTDLREVTRTLQNSLTNKDDTSAAIVDPPKDISDHAHAEHNWKYQVLKALTYEKNARISMEERINSKMNLLEQKNQDNPKMFAEMKAGLLSVNNIQEKQKGDNLMMFDEMKSGLSSVNDIQAKLKDQLKNLTTGLMESKCTRTKAGINKSENNCMIAFHALLAKNIDNLEPWKTIVFDHVRTNHGNAYSGSNGTFTAPRPGMYVFYIHILGSNRPMEVCLKKNNDCIVLLYSQGNGWLGSDDNMAVVDLAEGDRVYVVKNGIFGVAPFYVHHLFTNFAGFMLYPL